MPGSMSLSKIAEEDECLQDRSVHSDTEVMSD